MILVDSSAWIEYLRATGSEAHHAVKGLVNGGDSLATTEVVVMEILAGARDERHREQLSRLLAACELLALSGLGDYERAAEAWRACRRAGEAPRKLLDCLIAVVAIREDVPLLHCDADFDVIARHTELELAGVT